MTAAALLHARLYSSIVQYCLHSVTFSTHSLAINLYAALPGSPVAHDATSAQVIDERLQQVLDLGSQRHAQLHPSGNIIQHVQRGEHLVLVGNASGVHSRHTGWSSAAAALPADTLGLTAICSRRESRAKQQWQ